ncbi:MAG TPA: PAS domain S-box protein [Dehalococcoidia bacterium]|jgi:PAS domain S-box-containing protein|nr:PAS domain S-box protein [Dehalococcoidia bacterium]
MTLLTPTRADLRAGSAATSLLKLMDAATIAVVAVTTDGRFAYSNEAAEEALGYSQTDLPDRYLQDILDAKPDWIADQLATIHVERNWVGNVRFRHRNGSSIPFAINAFPAAQPADGPAYIGLMHPLDEHDAPNARLRAVAPRFQLNSRELCALMLMCEGFADKEIAALLGTSVWTVNKEVGKIMRKMNATSRTAACIAAIRSNLIF